nr:hypothetical protein [Tanacetum cinerariifolium]
MTSLEKCVALQERVGNWEWADMIALYCRNSTEEDSEFARRMSVLLQEMVAAYDKRVDFIRELETVSCVAATVKTTEFLNDALWKDDRRMQRLRKLQMNADLMAYEKEKFTREALMCLFVWGLLFCVMSCLINDLGKEAEEKAHETEMFVHKLKEINEDLRQAREINALCARATAIVDERESFVDELDILVGRREFELRDQEKGIFIKKLKGNLDF